MLDQSIHESAVATNNPAMDLHFKYFVHNKRCKINVISTAAKKAMAIKKQPSCSLGVMLNNVLVFEFHQGGQLLLG